MSSKRELVENKEVVQGVLIVDNFNDNFAPLTDEKPFALLPLINVPILEWSFEYLSLGGIEELFVFCCSHVEQIKRYITERIKNKALWSKTMTINVVISETCRSLGDCLRDLDAKGFIRDSFVLAEAGVIGNINFLPLIEKHNELTKKDKGIAMTLINVECGSKRLDECPFERQILCVTSSGRVIYHKRKSNLIEKKHNLPLTMFLEHTPVNIRSDLMDSRVMICSPSVLPLFTDNFDFQTKDDFIKGLLMNEDILGSTIYTHIFKVAYASAVTSWRRYQKISRELMHRWSHPIVPALKKIRFGEEVILGQNTTVADDAIIEKSIIGNNVKIGKNVSLKNCYIFSNCSIYDNSVITYSVIGDNCILKKNCKVTDSCVLGMGVVLNEKVNLQDVTVKSQPPDFSNPECKINDKAYRMEFEENSDNEDELTEKIKYSRLYCEKDVLPESSWESDLSDTEDELSHTKSPIPDDTKLFFNEVIDSLARGFEDKLYCENLILEINSSRYAYNVTLKEVNYNVVKAILSLPFQQEVGQQYWSSLRSSLEYFSPILKKYLKNREAMEDCLSAIEDVIMSNTDLHKYIVNILNWFYERDHLTEDVLVDWYSELDGNRIQEKVEPFIKWLQEAEEASSDDE